MSDANEACSKAYAIVEADLRLRGVNMITFRCCGAAVWYAPIGDDYATILGEATTLFEAANLAGKHLT